jgi:predicted NUDIX family NTP pyrophosphohydrolase
MPVRSAGILLYRRQAAGPEVLLVHPGGPWFVHKDLGAWSIPKGLYADDEDPLRAALREFQEETGYKLSGQGAMALKPVRQKGGKLVQAWAIEGDIDADAIESNTFPMQYPPRSGQWIQVPEVDRAAWFGLEEACRRINSAQAELIRELAGRFGWPVR